ncbi:FeoA family protein [Anaerovorax odorimutans]|uniref:FeoA family protein n=1 Tax=Anaerovorax odorimutans TaxID=109327 RepID=UPI000419BE0D|nr:FeoA family protein [Anaerovorax odorimutans]
MMPLTFLKAGEQSTIKRILDVNDTKKFLESLGFVVGSTVTVVSKIGDNMILNIKDSRIALDKDMARKIVI